MDSSDRIVSVLMADARVDYWFECFEPDPGPYAIDVAGKWWGFTEVEGLPGSVLWLGPWLDYQMPFPAWMGWPIVVAILLVPTAALWRLRRPRRVV